MRKSLTLIAIGALCLGCSQRFAEPDLGRQLQSILDAEVQNNDAVRSAALHVDAPALGLDWEGASGMADPEGGIPMTPETPSRIASNTKTFVAAAVLRLAEEGRLEIDDPIADHLPEEFVAMLGGDGYDTEAMTIRHLLTHTSGLFDPTAMDRYTETIIADPTHRWTRSEQLRIAMDWGDPHGGPGEYYDYCDPGYGLLGAIIEQSSEQPMAAAVRELLDYEKLGLHSTWWETLEPRPAGIPDRAHQFFGDYDTFDFHPSYDLYGGGGIVSTVGDLARFYRALFTGGVFIDPATADLMLTTVDGAEPLPNARPLGYLRHPRDLCAGARSGRHCSHEPESGPGSPQQTGPRGDQTGRRGNRLTVIPSEAAPYVGPSDRASNASEWRNLWGERKRAWGRFTDPSVRFAHSG
jgi:D-alanyl-D-alanine carboxypeptidase